MEYSFYTKYIAYSKSKPLESFTGKWAHKINDKLKINIHGGHETSKIGINIDPSQTPSGKLCRTPFSLHTKKGIVGGIALPVTETQLKQKSIVKTLQFYTPEKVIKNLETLSKNLP